MQTAHGRCTLLCDYNAGASGTDQVVWVCGLCKLHNNGTQRVCNACGSSREQSGQSLAPVVGGVVAGNVLAAVPVLTGIPVDMGQMTVVPAGDAAKQVGQAPYVVVGGPVLLSGPFSFVNPDTAHVVESCSDTRVSTQGDVAFDERANSGQMIEMKQSSPLPTTDIAIAGGAGGAGGTGGIGMTVPVTTEALPPFVVAPLPRPRGGDTPVMVVTVPAGVSEGHMIQIQTPSGAMMQVPVPTGLGPGDQFQCRV